MTVATVYVAGKSGGHIIPALTLAQNSKGDTATSYMIVHDLHLDRVLCRTSSALDGILFLSLRSGSFRNFWKYPWYIYDMMRAIVQCCCFLKSCRATQLVSMGGYISLPAVIAARIVRIPVIVYELNAIPGRAVKFLMPFVDEVRYCFSAAHQYFTKFPHAHYVPYPLKYMYKDLKPLVRVREQMRIPHDKYVLVVLGGSQGSHYLNHAICAWVAHVSSEYRERLYIIHQTGSHAATAYVKRKYDAQGIPNATHAFFENLSMYYCAADRVVTRAGAGALHELLFFRRKSLIVPLEMAADDHQVANAAVMVATHPDLFSMVRQGDTEQFVNLMTKFLAEE